MGGKASKNTPADRRLKENRDLPPRPPKPTPTPPKAQPPRRAGGRGR